MENTRGVFPLYYKVANAIQSKIERNEYEENSLVPSEQDLCKEFGVSRITIRHATGLLKRKGLIYSRAGYGTIVCPRQKGSEPEAKIVGTIDALTGFGSNSEFIPINRINIPAPAFVAEKLRC